MLVILVVGLYFLPAANAGMNRHHNFTAIFLLNLLLGWTIVGWIGAMVWSVTKPTPPQQLPPQYPQYYPQQLPEHFIPPQSQQAPPWNKP